MSRNNELPKFVTQLAGIFLLWFSFVCAFGSVYMILSPFVGPNLKWNITDQTVMLVGSGAFIVSVVAIMLSWRMIKGQRAVGGGLFSPRSLRIIAALYGGLMAFGLSYNVITDQFDFSRHALSLCAALFGVIGLLTLAHQREK